MKTIRFSPERVSIIARNTLLEAVRQKLFSFLVLISLGMILSSTFFRDFNFGSGELKFITDFGFGAITFFGSILAIVATAQLFFSEIENRTALTILAKPVFRSEFIFGKFFGVFLVLLFFCAIMAVSLAGVLYWREGELTREIPDAFADGRLVAYGDIFIFVFLQWLKFGILAAITMVIASFSNTNLYSVVMSFFILIICHLQYLARDAWEALGVLPVKLAVGLLGLIFPNFQLFNLGDQIALGERLPGELALRVALYGLVYILVFNAVAIYSFRKREI
ncbi:MAG: ABC transporter permease [Puniceicoccaceae bacterium]|nr:MAG: ABC transporter permease [Puniceicoccaceae bacterium]